MNDAMHKEWQAKEAIKPASDIPAMEPDDNIAMAKFLRRLQSGDYRAKSCKGEFWESWDHGQTWIKTA